MSDKVLEERYLVLFKQDVESLFDRVSKRHKEYVSIFAAQRTREHFDFIFRNKYETATMEMLGHCPRDVLEALGSFYREIDDLRWYFSHTEDMPISIQDLLQKKIKILLKLKNSATDCIDRALFAMGESLFQSEVISGDDSAMVPPPPPIEN